MPTAMSSDTRFYLEQSARITSAYVSNNRVSAPELPVLMERIHDTILSLASATTVTGTCQLTAAGIQPRSTAEIRKSIRPDGLVSFLDGRAYKTLKRHLTSHGLDPKSYRVRYGLPNDYPMVAEEYRARRSALATWIGQDRAGLTPSLGGQ